MSSIFLGLFSALLMFIYAALPPALSALGFHPQHESKPLNLKGYRALIISTSQDKLAPTNQATGVWTSEMTTPYYIFQDSGLEVDIASVQGGEIPLEPGSVDWPVASAADLRFLADPHLKLKVKYSLPIAELDMRSYDIIFLAGGWGAAYDLGSSKVLANKLTQAWAKKRILGGVCHGPLGLLQVKTPEGKLLIVEKRLTAVSDKQLAELGIGLTPQHPERELRAAGAKYENKSGLLDILNTHVVVDGLLVTGQNQNSAAETAYKMLKVLQAQKQ